MSALDDELGQIGARSQEDSDDSESQDEPGSRESKGQSSVQEEEKILVKSTGAQQKRNAKASSKAKIS